MKHGGREQGGREEENLMFQLQLSALVKNQAGKRVGKKAVSL